MNQFGCPHSKDPNSMPNSNRAGTGGPPDGTMFNLATGAMEQRSNGGNIQDENISRDSNEPPRCPFRPVRLAWSSQSEPTDRSGRNAEKEFDEELNPGRYTLGHTRSPTPPPATAHTSCAREASLPLPLLLVTLSRATAAWYDAAAAGHGMMRACAMAWFHSAGRAP